MPNLDFDSEPTVPLFEQKSNEFYDFLKSFSTDELGLLAGGIQITRSTIDDYKEIPARIVELRYESSGIGLIKKYEKYKNRFPSITIEQLQENTQTKIHALNTKLDTADYEYVKGYAIIEFNFVCGSKQKAEEILGKIRDKIGILKSELDILYPLETSHGMYGFKCVAKFVN